ncbi:MAG: hypothetical protein IJ563_04205 [Selenomonadaceae bacterium]|nr:hypothetical protein [Selenomonadaceae bacterium]MBR1859467.1 hypothetical protein [Selenomonadaceae bacterium]
MTISIDLNEAEAALVSKYAEQNNLTVPEFVHEVTTKAARNAEYLAMLDRGFKDMEDGNGTKVTFAELEKLING